MAFPSTEDFYGSAQALAGLALQCHAQQKPYVALYAGTSLEHLAKACLTSRSPALITELKDGNFPSLLMLVGIPAVTSSPLRTVGLQGALDRVKLLVSSKAAPEDLRALVGMRDGTVHAAASAAVQSRLMATFVQHADALVADLQRDRTEFWGKRITVADALLAGAKDEAELRVRLKLEDAGVSFRGYDQDLLEVLRRWARNQVTDDSQAQIPCPVCDSDGVAVGIREIGVLDLDSGRRGTIFGHSLTVNFHAESFGCPVCGLKLYSPAEIEAAGLESVIDEGSERVEELSGSYDDDADYERWRDGY